MTLNYDSLAGCVHSRLLDINKRIRILRKQRKVIPKELIELRKSTDRLLSLIKHNKNNNNTDVYNNIFTIYKNTVII